MPTLNWLGKDKITNHHQEVPFRPLVESYAYGDEGSGNKIIHGDNLEALKSLLPEYEGRIKCIYIDPPYNTGNENWVYNDNVKDPRISKWLNQVVGKEAEDFSRHDKWLCMMYPRLQLLKKLLSDDGAIFISIDDNELFNLKLILDEIMGGGNFVASMPIHRQGGRQDSKYFAIVHEYLVCYAKSLNNFNAGTQKKEDSSYPKYDEKLGRNYKTQLLRKWGSNSLRENRPNLYYPILSPTGEEVFPIIYTKSPSDNTQIIQTEGRWRWGKNTMEKAIEEGKVEFQKNENGDWIPYEKLFAPLEGECETKKFVSWIDSIGNGTRLLKEIFNGDSPFDYPKSTDLLEMVLKMANCDQSSIILDSFAGSGTTAHAVLNLNKADGGNRKFILVEMEDYAENITAERVRRVMAGYGEGKNAVEGTGGGFSFYELGEPLFNEMGELNPAITTAQLRRYVWHSEVHAPFVEDENRKDKYLLGINNGVAYYFFHEEDTEVSLSNQTANEVTTIADAYIIYADACQMSDELLKQNHITFKKFTSDVIRF